MWQIFEIKTHVSKLLHDALRVNFQKINLVGDCGYFIFPFSSWGLPDLQPRGFLAGKLDQLHAMPGLAASRRGKCVSFHPSRYIGCIPECCTLARSHHFCKDLRESIEYQRCISCKCTSERWKNIERFFHYSAIESSLKNISIKGQEGMNFWNEMLGLRHKVNFKLAQVV